MPRGLTPEQKDELAKRVRGLAYFVELLLPENPVRVWDGVGYITALGEQWGGVGEFGVISGVESDRTLKAQQLSLGLHGLPGDLIPGSVLAQTREIRYQGRPLAVYLGFTNVDTGQLIGDPTAIWSGVADVISFSVGAQISISLTGEHFSSHLRRPNGARMTTESHNQRLGNPDPRDLFFEPQNRLMGRPKPLLA